MAKVKDFVLVTDKMPGVKKHGPIASSSEKLIIRVGPNLQEVEAIYQRYDRDFNAPHLTAKKGDGFFFAVHSLAILKDVVSWKLA